MLDLSTLNKFKSDIEGNHVTAYPLIIIGADTDNPLYISTVKETLLDTEDENPLIFKDYNLKISNIKESVNLESHAIKISNVNITLSNYEQDGERLSDSITSSINVAVNVFYKTQSCSSIQDCLPLYKGIIRRVEHDDKNLKIQLEDLTDATFHKDVPIANMGTSKNCFNKDYINRYIPMTYGDVSKAPVIPYIDSVGELGNYYISIIPDDIEYVTGSGRDLTVTGFMIDQESPELIAFPTSVMYDSDGNPTSGNDKSNPLFIYKGDYFRVPRNYEKDFHNIGGDTLYRKPQQYQIDSTSNFLKVEKIYSSGFAQNPPASNEFQAMKMYYPSQAEILKTEATDGDIGSGNSRVINIPTTIKNPDAAVDNLEMPSIFIDEDSFDEFASWAEVPYYEVDIEAQEGPLVWEVSGFRPSYKGTDRNGIYCPGKGSTSNPDDYSFEEADWVGTTNYLHLVSAWLQVNAHWTNKSVKFVSMPTGNMIRSDANEWIRDPANGFSNNTDSFRDDSYAIRVVPQYCLDGDYRDKWCEASMIPNNQTRVIGDYTTTQAYADHIGVAHTNDIGTIYWDRGGNYSIINTYDLGATGNQVAPERIHYYFPGTLSEEEAEAELDYYQKYQLEHIIGQGLASNYSNLAPISYRFEYKRNGVDTYYQKDRYITNRDLLRGYEADLAENGKAPCYYPSTVFKMGLQREHLNNVFELTHLYIGQWNETTMGSYSTYGEDLEGFYRSKWINIFRDPDLPDIPYLYEMDDFAVFTPTGLMEKEWGDAVSEPNNTDPDELSVMVKYYSEWNGNEMNTYKGTDITKSSSYVSNHWYTGGYGLNETSNSSNHTGPKIKESDLCDKGDRGQAWFMYIADEIPGDQVMTPKDDNIGEYTIQAPHDDAGTIIPKGCLIPCNHKHNENHGSNTMGWEEAVIRCLKGTPTVLGDSPGQIRILAGSETLAETRLGLLFPFTNINAEDAIETETCTFVFGSIDVEFPEDIGDGSEENPFAHNMGSDDTFLLQAYGAETTESDELDYNAEFVGGDMFATNLIKIDGNASVFSQNSGEYTEKWHFNDVNTHFGNMKDYLIEAWDSPGKFDALSLAYRVNGSVDTGSQPSVTLSTKVYSIGIIQFNQFDNALNSDMYADVSGRNNGPNDVHVTNMFNAVYKYTNNPYLGSGHDPINHPTDIIYHIIEKELNQIDIVDRDSLNQARENSMISKMGFSITDKTNSRKLIESICKNTNLYPRFGNNGEFDFKIIRDSYSDNDIDISIKQKDIIKFSFTRTPIENVITMVNVKYKKDYAKDEYSKDTGYCDAHDFFGNGDNGADVLRYNGDLNNSYEGYDYNLFGLDRLSNVLEFESDFIRTRSQANKLRDFLLMQNCNQHTIIKCTLPLKYIYAEVGDVVHFDKLNNNTKAYGEDYSGDNNNIVSRNGQEIYPYFIITSVTKSSKDIKIECMQLHRLERTFNAGLGSLSRRSEVGLHGLLSQFTLNTEEIFTDTTYEQLVYADLVSGDFTFADLDIFESILQGNVAFFTAQQKKSADLDGNGMINQEDVNMILSFFALVNEQGSEGSNEYIIGDANQDGEVNVADIIAVVNYILLDDASDIASMYAANVTIDNDINVADIAGMVGIILGGSS